MEKPFFHIGDVLIAEPMAASTDFLVTGVYIWALIRHFKNGRDDISAVFFRYFFFFMATGAFLGGLLGHAFLYEVGNAWKFPGWLSGLIAVSFLELAVGKEAKPYMQPGLYKLYELFVAVELLLFGSLTLYYGDFIYVAVRSFISLIGIVTPLQIHMYIQTKGKGNIFLLSAIGITFISAVIFLAAVGFHKWFNHIALSHFILAVSAFFFYLSSNHIFSYEPLNEEINANT